MNKSSLKKILIVTDFYQPHISGIVTYIDQMLTVFVKKKFKITILTTQHQNNLKFIEKNKTIQIIRCKPTIKASRGSYSFSLVKKFIQIHKNYDYVNIHFPLTEIFPIAFFLKKKILYLIIIVFQSLGY